MLAQPGYYFVFTALIELHLHFFQGKMHYVMMVKLERSDALTESQPQAVQKIHFVAGKVRGVRAENLVKFFPVWQMDFQVELRLGIAQLFPGIADVTSLLFGQFLGRMAEDNG